jgi:aarF domain-containing kinase
MFIASRPRLRPLIINSFYGTTSSSSVVVVATRPQLLLLQGQVDRTYMNVPLWRRTYRNTCCNRKDIGWRHVHSTSGSSSNESVTLNTSQRFSSFLSTKSLVIMGASIGAVAASVIYMTHDYFEGSEGIQRAASFYSLAIPKYIIYRYHQLVQSPDHVWEQLDQETSQEGLDIILRLKGFYIKCGQMCASNIGNAFPVVWQETMSILQDQVPPEDFNSVILPIIQSELPNYQQIFTYIDPIPIGSASIGQVHRAKMIIRHPDIEGRSQRNTSDSIVTKDVVIKICYPHVERLLRGDVRTIRTFCEIAQPVHVPAMREVEKQFVTEFDYVQEANNLYEVRTNLIQAELCQATTDDDSSSTAICTVPFPYRQYCTKRVLVMEEIHGDKLVDVLKRDGQRWMEWASKMESMKSSASASTATNDTHSRTISEASTSDKRITTEEFQRYLSLMDTSRRIQNGWNRIYNSTIGWIMGKQVPYQYASDLPLNPSKLVDDLLYIHGHQVLVDGRFNADCHPGTLNILWTVFCYRSVLNTTEYV